jgi:multimeric flavodoxin WrbA
MVVFATPIYYFGMSSQLKMVIDRFYSFNGSLSGSGLKTALIAAAWNSNDKTMSYLKEHYLGICDYLGFDNEGMILGTECGSPSMTRGSRHMKEAYELGKSLK